MKRLITLAIVGGPVYGAARLVMAKKAEWEGLTEGELRSKLDAKLAGRVPDEAVDQIKEGVVRQMQAMGRLRDDETRSDDAGVGTVEAG